MKKLFTILCAVMLTISLSAQTEAGTFYMALGNAYSPMQSGPLSSLFSNSSGMSFGNEWITGITVDGDDDEGEPYRTSRLEFGTGMAFFLTESIALEPSVNFALNTYTQEQEVYIGSDPITGNSIYDDQDRKTSTNAFYFKIAASMYF